jgi:phage FluMu protein Com
MPLKFTKEIFLEKANLKHKQKYNYNNFVYINSKIKGLISCEEHGDFYQSPNDHLQGHGCPRCAGLNKKTTQEFIEIATKIHGDKYDYSEFVYCGINVKGIIICKKHGSFLQKPSEHIHSKSGCKKCSGHYRQTTQEFIDKSNKIHNFAYEYLDTYKTKKTKFKIRHKKCDKIFYQTPEGHMRGYGCPYCKSSKGEKIIKEFLEENKILFDIEKRFSDCKNKTELPFDFYLVDKNLLIEYDGEQHFKEIKSWGGKKRLDYVKNNDKIKDEFARSNGIKLLRISYKEFDKIREILQFNIS